MTAASGRWTTAITPTTSRPFSRAMARSWMSRIANWARPESSSLTLSVEDDGAWTRSVTPSASS
jgi:hypothetical protein